jgi:hypothetical protein
MTAETYGALVNSNKMNLCIFIMPYRCDVHPSVEVPNYRTTVLRPANDDGPRSARSHAYNRLLVSSHDMRHSQSQRILHSPHELPLANGVVLATCHQALAISKSSTTAENSFNDLHNLQTCKLSRRRRAELRTFRSMTTFSSPAP